LLGIGRRETFSNLFFLNLAVFLKGKLVFFESEVPLIDKNELRK
jgi:hypothetical protein